MTLPSLQYTLDFRNASLGAGGTTTVTGTPAALTIPSGATLGTISGVQSTIAKVVINNAGTLEYAVVNIAGGNDLSETGVISTTAISGTSTANNVFYSNTARSNVPYRVVEILQSTQATAGTWATAPSLVQGVGGEAFTAFSGFGKTQKYNSYNSSTRAVGTTYYNTTQNTIFVLAGITSTSTSGLSATIILGGNTTSLGSTAFVSGTLLQLLFPVPPGASYSVTSTAGTPAWASWVEFS